MELRLAFSVGSSATKCVFANFPSSEPLFPAERFSFSDEAIAIIEKMTKMTVTEKEAILDALWVSIKHIIVIFPQLRLAFSEKKRKITRYVLLKLIVVIIFDLKT